MRGFRVADQVIEEAAPGLQAALGDDIAESCDRFACAKSRARRCILRDSRAKYGRCPRYVLFLLRPARRTVRPRRADGQRKPGRFRERHGRAEAGFSPVEGRRARCVGSWHSRFEQRGRGHQETLPARPAPLSLARGGADGPDVAMGWQEALVGHALAPRRGRGPDEGQGRSATYCSCPSRSGPPTRLRSRNGAGRRLHLRCPRRAAPES